MCVALTLWVLLRRPYFRGWGAPILASVLGVYLAGSELATPLLTVLRWARAPNHRVYTVDILGQVVVQFRVGVLSLG